MHLYKIRLYNFRNLTNRELSLHPSINLISGDNGEGKSNLIEAIHLLSSTKSFRSSTISELTQWGLEEFSVFGELQERDSITTLGVSLEKGRRKIYWNEDLIRSAEEYLRVFPTVTFAPQNIDLIFGSPSGRRKVIDRYTSLLFPSYFRALTKYQKILRSKNALLKSSRGLNDELLTYNEILADCSLTISEGRREFLKTVIPIANEVYNSFAKGDGELTVLLDQSFRRKGSEEDSLESYFKVFSEIAEDEIMRKTSLVGPHLDEFVFTLGERSARSFASQGQARSIVLSLFVAIVNTLEKSLGKPPTLLLDDFSSELDSGRMRLFFDLLMKNVGQVFVTGTELSGERFPCGEHTHFSVKNGEIQELK